MDATKGKDDLSATIKAGLNDLLRESLISLHLLVCPPFPLICWNATRCDTSFEEFRVGIRELPHRRILKPVSDRIFSTAVDASYTLASPPSSLLALSSLGQLGSLFDYSTIAQNVKSATIETFALDESASVQATLCKTAERVLAENKDIVDVRINITYRWIWSISVGQRTCLRLRSRRCLRLSTRRGMLMLFFSLFIP